MYVWNSANVYQHDLNIFKKMGESSATSGLRDYVGGKYADLMQKFWVALKSTGLLFGTTPDTWAQSLDQGPLLGRRFHQCGPGQVPVFMNKTGDVIPPSEAITWIQGRPFLNEGVVDISKGGCGPAIGANIDAGPLTMYGATTSVAGALAHRGRDGLPFDASAVLLNELSGGGKAKMHAKSRHRRVKRDYRRVRSYKKKNSSGKKTTTTHKRHRKVKKHHHHKRATKRARRC
jgi:hypothetical protein